MERLQEQGALEFARAQLAPPVPPPPTAAWRGLHIPKTPQGEVGAAGSVQHQLLPCPLYLTFARGPVLSKLSLESGPSLEDFLASE